MSPGFPSGRAIALVSDGRSPKFLSTSWRSSSLRRSSRPGTVAKADVIARLCTSTLPFATVVAPAGYGKTTLLARWAEADPRPFAWVALDGRDDDAVVFLRYIAAAIHGVEPLPPEVFDALSGPGGSSWATRVPRVGSALAALEHPLVLVLDDLHAVANPSCLDVLAELFGTCPAGSQIAIASREEPPLPLARWRAQGSVHEIGVADLRLDEQEAGLLLQAAGVELDAGELSELTERTEGWPAGLYLAALSMQAGAPSSVAAAGFTGDDRFVSDYFRLELLSRLPAAEAHFLKYTSVLERMCGGLCDAVLQTTRSAHTLETLERTNCFVVPLDRRGEWYRYHHLFGQLLRTELERSEPEMMPALNRRAMAWCIDQRLRPRRRSSTGTLPVRRTPSPAWSTPLRCRSHYDGRMETLEEWLGWFSDDELRRYPALAVYGAWVRALTGRPAEAERWLALADGATSTIPLSDGSATIEPWVATLRAAMMPDGVEQALADADLALDQLPPESGWRPAALVLRGTCARAARRNRSGDGRPHGGRSRRGLAAGAAEEVYRRTGAARAPRGQAGSLGRGRATRGRGTSARRRGGPRRLLVERARARGDGACRTPRGQTGGCPRGADARAPSAADARPRPSLADDPGRARAHPRPSRARRARRGSHGPQPRPSRCSSSVRTWARWSRMRESSRERVAATAGSGGAWAMSLTGAELRLLPYLATHLTFPEIATRLFISRNTVKSEAVSIYRKLGVSSRSEAIERAVEVGLLESSVYPPAANLIPEG